MQNNFLQLEPIGYFHSQEKNKFELSPQPTLNSRVQGLVRLQEGRNYDVALRDLDGFSRIWLTWWFHKNESWKPTTLPPRGRVGRKGIFATRSPYRPNPLAISCVKLLEIRGHELLIGAHDLLDGTPVLDIKPYIPKFDSFEDASTGWFEELEEQLREPPSYQVCFSSEVTEMFRQNRELELKAHITELLSRDPFPHRTRRIISHGEGYRMSCGDWRIHYIVDDVEVKIKSLAKRC